MVTADGAESAERCDVCGEPLRGELAEVVRREDGCQMCWHDFATDRKTDHWHEPGPSARHLVVHEPCFDRETMELA